MGELNWRKWEDVGGLMTVDEKKAVDALRRLAKKWPDTLWIFADGNSLHVTRCGKDGERVMLPTEGVDPDMIVESINIPNDGGDF